MYKCKLANPFYLSESTSEIVVFTADDYHLLKLVLC